MNKPPIRLPAGLPALHPLRFAWTGLALLTALLAVWGLALLRPAPAQAEASATALISISFYTTYDPAASTTIYEDRLAWGKVSLSDQAGGNQDPTGSVQLTAAEIGLNCTITYTNGSDGEGECAFIPSQSGTFTVTAAYSGDSKFNPASKQISQTISAFANSPTRLSAGRSQTCLLKPDQTLRCWGEPMTIPIDASGAPRTVSGYVAVSAGSYHTCAIRAADGGIDCWGDDGTITNTVPTGQFSAISSGEQHVCALDANHAVKCWGHLDDGLTAAHSGAYRWISAGDKNDCAIDLDDSTTECWGSSANINSYHGVLRELAVGNNHACGIKNDGALHCWGALSNSDTSSVFSEIDSGSGYSCAHDSQDRLKCWGGATTPLVNPRLVYPEFSAGFLHVCALRSKTGGYYLACWANPDNKFYDQAPRLSLAPTSIAAYLPRDRYWSQALTPSGGHPNYTLAHTAGTLPPGISLSGAGVLTGTLAGTPTVANSYAFTVTTSENFSGSALPLELEPRAAAYTTIIQDPSTSVSIGLNPTSAAAGIPVKITVNVSKTGAPALGGSVTITSTEAEVGCSVAVSGSSAECTVSFSTAGAVTVYATYQGDDFYTRSPRGSAAITISAPSFTPALAAGKAFNLSLALDGKLFGWGKDDSGQASPDPTIAYSTVTAGEAHACARKLNGRAACWGWNGYGQAGPPSGTSFALLSAGRLHTCGVQQDGRLACWGSAAGNRLAAPADLIAITDGALAAGQDHTCALRSSDAHPVCWGVSLAGDNRLAAPALAFTRISAGSRFTCGIQSGGSLSCWGSGPGATPPTGTFQALSAGNEFACGITTGGALDCWGTRPAGVPDYLSGHFTRVAAGYDHACALDGDNHLQCWGANDSDQAPALSFSPLVFPSLDLGQAADTQLQISGGREDAYRFYDSGGLPPGLDIDDTSGHYSGVTTQAGSYTFPVTVTEQTLSQALVAVRSYTQIVRSPVTINVLKVKPLVRRAVLPGPGAPPMAGEPLQISFAITETPGTKLRLLGLFPSGTLTVTAGQVTGSPAAFTSEASCSAALVNGHGQCVVYLPAAGEKQLELAYSGDTYFIEGNTAVNRYLLRVDPFQKPVTLLTTIDRSVLYDAAGGVQCVGSGCPALPASPANGGVSIDYAIGPTATCRLTTRGAAACTGLVVPSSGNYGFVAITTGWDHACALRYDGSLACWGSNADGKANPPGGVYQAVSAGRYHTCAIAANGTLACWGAVPGSPPAAVAGGPDGQLFAALSAGESHSCARRNDGSLACWGENGSGQSTPPTGEFSQVAVGASHTCALGSDNRIVCWGADSAGQSPAPYGLFTTLAAFGNHACALRSAVGSGSPLLTCWGDNTAGQAPRIQISSLDRPSVPALQYFEHFFNPAGGTQPYQVELPAGILPQGVRFSLDLGPAGVVLYGTPRRPQVYPFRLFWQDSSPIPLALEQPYTLTVTGAELGVAISSSYPSGALWGSPLTFHYDLDNSAALEVPTAALTVTLPAGLANVSFSGLPACSQTGLQIVCDLSGFSGGGSQALEVTGVVTAPVGSVLTTTAVIQPQADGWPELQTADNTARLGLGVALRSQVFNDTFTPVALDPGWSSGERITTTKGPIYLGTFTADDSLRLTLDGLPPHKRVTLLFDVLVIGAWPGSAEVAPSVNALWSFGQFGEPPLLTTTFCAAAGCTQAFPFAFPLQTYPGLTAAAGQDELGLETLHDARYSISRRFAHSSPLLDLLFASFNLPAGAQWGIDNVQVWVDQQLPELFLPLLARP